MADYNISVEVSASPNKCGTDHRASPIAKAAGQARIAQAECRIGELFSGYEGEQTDLESKLEQWQAELHEQEQHAKM